MVINYIRRKIFDMTLLSKIEKVKPCIMHVGKEKKKELSFKNENFIEPKKYL